MEIAELEQRLRAFIADAFARDATLANVRVSDGHAGLTFLFDVINGGRGVHACVIKMPPKGVAYRGNTDVYRQAPLMRALLRGGLPVPNVPFAYEENAWFETPFIVMERLPGTVFFVWDPRPPLPRDEAGSAAIWRQCIDHLPLIHEFDWHLELDTWDIPEPLEDNVRRWRRIYQQAPESRWIAAAERVEARLLEVLPDGDPIGLFHGDYQPGNVLYKDGVLTGIIDWELAGIGSQLQDVGWLMMVCDPANWGDSWRPVYPPSPEHLRQRYEAAMGKTFAALPWYQAFAGFRLGSIGCLNVKLHRSGQRRDAIWEHMALTIETTFERAEAILAMMD